MKIENDPFFDSLKGGNAASAETVKAQIIIKNTYERTLTVENCEAVGVAPARMTASFDNYVITDTAQRDVVKALTTAGDSWYIFTGNTGTGKKHLSVALLKEKYKAGLSCLMINAKRLFVSIDDARNARQSVGDVLDYYSREIDFLVIDEIGRSTKSEAELNNLFEILDTRYEYNKQTILISNLSWQELSGLFDAALIRRIKSKSQLKAFSWAEFKQEVKK